jgi:hypothetical protein
MKYPAADVDIGVISELYTAGTTEDGGDYVAEQYRVVARVRADGRTFMLSHYWKGCEVSEDGEGGTYFADVREKAAASAEIDAEGFRALAVFDTEMHGSPANPDAEWYETEPEYGSKHWQALDAAEGQAARFDRSIALHRAGEPQDEYTRLSEANMSVSTQAQVPIAQVTAACDAYLANNDARVEREREALIEQHTTAGLFRKAKTREEAIGYLKSNFHHGMGYFTDWDYPKWKGGAFTSQVKAMRALAVTAEKGGETTMQIGTSDFSLIEEYWPVEEPADAETLAPAM